MTANRSRSAWVWVAIAAMAVASLARVESGGENAVAYSNAVLEFLAGHANAGTLTSANTQQVLHLGSAPKASLAILHGASTGAWTAFLPVLFVGLIAPLSLISPKSFLSLGRAPSMPLLAALFERPPPALL